MRLRALVLSVLVLAGCGNEVVEHAPAPKSSPKKRKPTPAPTAAPTPDLGDVWQRLADCESGERDQNNKPIPGTADWDIENPPYTGGVQFMLSTWRLAGGTKHAPTAGQASRAEQIAVAKSWLAKTSWAQWPRCSRIIGVRG